MTNAKLIAKIRAEIEKQIKDPQEHCYGVSSVNKLRELLDFINGLESEKPMNQEGLEEEIDKRYLQTRVVGYQDGVGEILLGREAFGRIARHFAQWGAEHTPLPEDTVLFNKGVAEGKRLAEEEQADLFTIVALDAAQRAQEQMMKEAVEGEVVKDINNKLVVTAKNVNLDGFKFGEKVIIIIVKEDEA